MPQFFKNKHLVIVIVIVIVLITTGAKCGSLPAGWTAGSPTPITLEYWKVYEESFNISDFISAYQAQHPEVTINYKNFTPEEYETELLRALAEDRGPDIISLHTTWMKKYQSLITPLPAALNIPYKITKGTIKKENFTELRSQKALTLLELRNLFPDVVYNNQVISNQIYGLPLSIDTMALFYNRDLLNNAGIAAPPVSWEQFQEQIVKLTRLDIKGNIIQSGAGIGTADNVERATDILSLLMMQNGAQMTDSTGAISFNLAPAGYTRAEPPAVEALNYYNSFASPVNQVYTWNADMPSSLNSFMAGKSAFYLGYAYNIPTIRAQAPKLNFGISAVPQISEPAINYANYWVETVSKKSQHLDQAWDFVTFMATNADSNKKFLANTKKPAALKSLIASQLDDQDLSVFASQILTAKSWYKGKNVQAMENIFKSMISDNLAGVLPTIEIINLGAQKVSQTLR